MAKTVNQMMQKMVEPLQKHCPEPIDAAMACSHAGTMVRGLQVAILRTGAFGGIGKTSDLPNPVLIGVGEQGVYAFTFKPSGFKLKVKKEVRRWPRSDVAIATGEGTRINSFSLCTPEGHYDLEVTTMNSDRANELLDRFFDRIGRLEE